MRKECLVVPRSELVQANFIPPETEGQLTYTRIGSLGELKKLLRIAQRSGQYRERTGEQGVENDPSVQQLIMYGFVSRPDGSFLLYKRSSGSNYAENRLASKASIGIGGHMEPTDLTLAKSFYRELEEEAQIVVDNSPIVFRNGGYLNIRFMKELVSITPVALIKDERDDVGKVHFGVVCKITPKSPNVEIRVKTGEGEESLSWQYVSLADYQAMVARKEIIPEGWTQVVIEQELSKN